MICLSPFLWTGIILDFFQISGKIPLSIQFLNIIDKGLIIDWQLIDLTIVGSTTAQKMKISVEHFFSVEDFFSNFGR